MKNTALYSYVGELVVCHLGENNTFSIALVTFVFNIIYAELTGTVLFANNSTILTPVTFIVIPLPFSLLSSKSAYLTGLL